MIIMIILHSTFIVRPVITINNEILNILLALHYLTLLFIIVDYIIIVSFDPVDPLIVNPGLIEVARRDKNTKLKICTICKS